MRKHWKRTIAFIITLLIVMLFSIISIGYIRYRTTINDKPLEQVVTQIRSQKDYVTIDQIDSNFLDAIIAVEDPSFFEHSGIVLSNIAEAFFTNMKAQDLVMGGSTITQQLSKNLYLDQRKTFQRKVAEIFFVQDIEAYLSKEEILELYVNVIYYGDGFYGIKQASEGYFNIPPTQLTIAQATLLAGLPQAPAIYQLSDGLQLAKKRQQIVLNAMEKEKLLNEADILTIYNQPIYE